MQDNQLVQIGVCEFAADLESSTHREFVLLVELQYIDMLEDIFGNLPRDSQVVESF